MSYILDALKKAEAQRHLGGVPSIHAAAPGDGGTPDAQPFWRKHLPWLIAGFLALALLGYVLWSQTWHRTGPATATPAVLVSTPAPAPTPTPSPVAAAPEAQPQPVPAPTREVAQPAAPAPIHAAPALTAEKPAHAVAPAQADTPRAEAMTPAAKSTTTAATTAAPTAATAPAPEEEAGTVQDLPTSIQRELPPVTVNGYIYARNPADRSALINKKLLHEGDAIAPDLVLERLTPKGAVLNYKGYRYRVSY